MFRLHTPYFCPEGEEIEMVIYDLLGRKVFSKNLKTGNNVCEINTRGFIAGTYILRFTFTSGNTKNIKFVKQQ